MTTTKLNSCGCKSILIAMLMVFSLKAQEILKLNQTYKFATPMVLFTENQFDKLDILLADTLKYQKKIVSFEEQITVMDSIDSLLKKTISDCDKQFSLCNQKIVESNEKFSLSENKNKLYVDQIKSLQLEVEKCNKIKPSRLTWFGVGFMSGVGVVIIGAIFL